MCGRQVREMKNQRILPTREELIAMGYPFGWVLAAVLFLIVYYRRGLEYNRVLA